MLVSVITCTGFRPEAFNLCKRFLGRQTWNGPIQWIVVTDQPDFPKILPPKENITVEHVKAKRNWTEGFNTQRFNMEHALRKVEGQFVIIFEDDEFYAPNYIQTCMDLLRFADIVGEGNSKYYHVGIPGFKEMANIRHASLCQTALRSSQLPLLKAAVDSGELYFDIKLWETAREKKVPTLIRSDSNLVIGMKGMPGRGNIGAGGRLRDYQLDPKLEKLKLWVGTNAGLYTEFIRNGKGTKVIKEAPRLQESSKENPVRGPQQRGSGSNPSVSNQKGLSQSQTQKPAS